MDIILGVIGNGRFDLLERTVRSLKENVSYPFAKKIMVNDTGDLDYAFYLENLYGKDFHIINHLVNLGLSGSVRTLWSAARALQADCVFHLEEDFLFNQPVDIKELAQFLVIPGLNIAQVALKRQPVNGAEAEVGGFMQQNPAAYSELKVLEKDIVIHKEFFTLNPCIYPNWVMELGWEIGWGEKEFGERLFADPTRYCAYYGTIDDPPIVEHTGHYRGNNWFV